MTSTPHTDVLVIGAGPGGYVAAIRASQLGKQVTIVEKKHIGGACLNVGCIPSKALIEASHYAAIAEKSGQTGVEFQPPAVNFEKLQQWKGSIVNQLTEGVSGLLQARKINIITGEVSFIDKHTVQLTGGENREMTFSSCIIATGSSPLSIPAFPFGEQILSSTEALSLKERPSSLAIIGGGYIGIELGTMFANFGTEVTIFEGLSSILPGFSSDMADIVHQQLAAKRNVSIKTETAIDSVVNKKEGVKLYWEESGEKSSLEADYVLVTVGRKPNTASLGLVDAGINCEESGLIPVDGQCRTNQSHIFAIGDVTPGPALAHRASLQGKMAAEALDGGVVDANDYVIPAVVFSEPPLAAVGLSEEAAHNEGYSVEVQIFPMSHNGRALTVSSPQGFVKLVVNREDQTVLGAEAAGEGAPELINELAVCVQSELTAEDISLVVHAHPTLGESIMEAAEKTLGVPIHSM
ncbi:dihydrolipoyl dehydrogenase [Alteribacillus sp. HJP-4]|uniref:dihydrolipoyl dehydrogenase n=1 Tax=Alteribacillus sp. HJP-4 TaxID=2775394 RepID=UPI0035CCE30F